MTRTGAKPRKVCVCGHGRKAHPARPVTILEGAMTKSWCIDPNEGVGCGCDGWCEPAKPGDRLVFGTSRIPHRHAITAPAWAGAEEE